MMGRNWYAQKLTFLVYFMLVLHQVSKRNRIQTSVKVWIYSLRDRC